MLETPAVAAPAVPAAAAPATVAGVSPLAPIPASNVPEKGYEYKVPEGHVLDKAHIEKVNEFARSVNLTQEQAQKFFERDLAQNAAYYEQAITKAHDEIKKQNAVWLGELQADKDFGGAKFGETAELAKRAISIGDPDGSFRKDLDGSGWANHPGLVKVFARIGRVIASDKLGVSASSAPSAQKTLEQKLYPSMVPKKA